MLRRLINSHSQQSMSTICEDEKVLSLYRYPLMVNSRECDDELKESWTSEKVDLRNAKRSARVKAILNDIDSCGTLDESSEDSCQLCVLEEISLDEPCTETIPLHVEGGRSIIHNEKDIDNRICEQRNSNAVREVITNPFLKKTKISSAKKMIVPNAIYIVNGRKHECTREMKKAKPWKDDNKKRQIRAKQQENIKTVRECSDESGKANQAHSRQFEQEQCANKKFDDGNLVAVPSETCEKLKWSIKTDVENDENKCSNSRRLSEVKVINATYLSCHPTQDANKTQKQEHKTNDTQQNQDQSSSFQARDEPTKILIQHAKDLSQGLNVAEKNNDNKNKLTRRTTYSSRQNGIWKEDDVNEKLIGSIDLIDGAKILKSGKNRNLTQTDLFKEKVTSVKNSICATKNNVMKKDLKKMCAKFYPIFNQKNNVES